MGASKPATGHPRYELPTFRNTSGYELSGYSNHSNTAILILMSPFLRDHTTANTRSFALQPRNRPVIRLYHFSPLTGSRTCASARDLFPRSTIFPTITSLPQLIRQTAVLTSTAICETSFAAARLNFRSYPPPPHHSLSRVARLRAQFFLLLSSIWAWSLQPRD